jgi:hypothetical protein
MADQKTTIEFDARTVVEIDSLPWKLCNVLSAEQALFLIRKLITLYEGLELDVFVFTARRLARVWRERHQSGHTDEIECVPEVRDAVNKLNVLLQEIAP